MSQKTTYVFEHKTILSPFCLCMLSSKTENTKSTDYLICYKNLNLQSYFVSLQSSPFMSHDVCNNIYLVKNRAYIGHYNGIGTKEQKCFSFAILQNNIPKTIETLASKIFRRGCIAIHLVRCDRRGMELEVDQELERHELPCVYSPA